MKRVLILIGVSLPLSLIAEVTTEIRGRVVDGLTHQALSECHVFVDNQIGVLTNEEGFFTLEIPEERMQGTLSASFMGYTTFTIPLDQLTGEELNIDLARNVILMEELVVYSDKWLMLEETMLELAQNYPDREAFYAELMARMETLDGKLPEPQQSRIASSTWQIIIISTLILALWSIICRPLFRDVFVGSPKFSG